jgi:hypothetical protein
MYKSVGDRGSITDDEICLLVRGLPNLHSIGDHLLCRFDVVKAVNATTLWINHRWLERRGMRVADPATKLRLENWFAREFGYVVDDPSHPLGAVDRSDRRTFGADRYGSNNGLVAHGGSGRAAAVGHFHIKGVGVTPLVGKGVNREHSHGSASLNSALRETIYAEISDEEFPHGAIPTVAIIDTGLTYESSGSPARQLRRSIIVRPAMLRTAHLQRAAGFIEPVDGHTNSQIVDARRTREMVSYFVDFDGRKCSAERMNQHFEHLAEQIAFGQVHRIYNGGYFSSNVSLNAALLDFGNMHVLSNWVNTKVLDSDLGFGREMLTLEATINSLDFHFRKYAGQDHFNRDAALARARSRYESTFRTEALRAFGILDITQDDEDGLLGAIRALYEAQQRISINYTRTGESQDGWIGSVMRPGDKSTRDDRWSAHCKRITDQLVSVSDPHSHSPDLYRSMDQRRLLGPRYNVMRSAIQEEVDELLMADRNVNRDRISHFIDQKVSSGRRHWKSLPSTVAVEAHAYKSGCSVLKVRMRSTGASGYWVEGISSQAGTTLLGRPVPKESLRELGVALDSDRWSLSIETTDDDGTIVIGDVVLAVPAMDWTY